MNVLAPGRIRRFWEQHPAAKDPLRAWQRTMQRSFFANWAELTNMFPSIDYVQGANKLAIFSIGGNKYRLIASISFTQQRVYIKHIFTHAEYDAWNKGGRK